MVLLCRFSSSVFVLSLQVVSLLTTACCCLMVRVVFGLLAVDHSKFSNEPKLLYTVLVLPELLALYIIAIPGLVPKVGWDCEAHMGICPTGLDGSSRAKPYGQTADDDPLPTNPSSTDRWCTLEDQGSLVENKQRMSTSWNEGKRPEQGQGAKMPIGVHRGQSGLADDFISSTPVAWGALAQHQ